MFGPCFAVSFALIVFLMSCDCLWLLLAVPSVGLHCLIVVFLIIITSLSQASRNKWLLPLFMGILCFPIELLPN